MRSNTFGNHVLLYWKHNKDAWTCDPTFKTNTDSAQPSWCTCFLIETWRHLKAWGLKLHSHSTKATYRFPYRLQTSPSQTELWHLFCKPGQDHLEDRLSSVAAIEDTFSTPTSVTVKLQSNLPFYSLCPDLLPLADSKLSLLFVMYSQELLIRINFQLTHKANSYTAVRRC